MSRRPISLIESDSEEEDFDESSPILQARRFNRKCAVTCVLSDVDSVE